MLPLVALVYSSRTVAVRVVGASRQAASAALAVAASRVQMVLLAPRRLPAPLQLIYYIITERRRHFAPVRCGPGGGAEARVRLSPRQLAARNRIALALAARSSLTRWSRTVESYGRDHHRELTARWRPPRAAR